MDKRGISTFMILSLLLVFLLIGVIAAYYLFYTPDNEQLYSDQEGKSLINPVSGLSKEEAISNFDKGYIYYLFYRYEAYNLHNPPLSKNTPKIEVNVEGELYSIEIDNGIIKLYDGGIDEEDIIFITDKESVVKILQSENIEGNYGNSNIELVSSKAELASKGYLSLYKKITGKSITGSLIKIH